jgi:hypothetical protein
MKTSEIDWNWLFRKHKRLSLLPQLPIKLVANAASFIGEWTEEDRPHND